MLEIALILLIAIFCYLQHRLNKYTEAQILRIKVSQIGIGEDDGDNER